MYFNNVAIVSDVLNRRMQGSLKIKVIITLEEKNVSNYNLHSQSTYAALNCRDITVL